MATAGAGSGICVDATRPNRSSTGSCTASLLWASRSAAVTSRGQVYLAMHRSPCSAKNCLTARVMSRGLGCTVAARVSPVAATASVAAIIHIFMFMFRSSVDAVRILRGHPCLEPIGQGLQEAQQVRLVLGGHVRRPARLQAKWNIHRVDVDLVSGRQVVIKLHDAVDRGIPRGGVGVACIVEIDDLSQRREYAIV